MSKPIKLVLIGSTGVGKSTLGNMILGNEAFKTGASFSHAVTLTSVHKDGDFIYGGKVRVVDTQGYSDPAGTDYENS